MNQSKGLIKWHEFVKSREMSKLNSFIAEDAVFHSPVVWTPQKGKKIVEMYLIAAGQIIGNDHFEYIREVFNDNFAVLEFKTIVDGISIEGVDMLTFNEKEELIDMKVMIRPLKAINILHQKMGELLLKMK